MKRVKCAPVPIEMLRPLENCIRKYGVHGDRACDQVANRTIRLLHEDHDPIGSGIHRSTFLLGHNCVLKVAKGLWGSESNLREAGSWQQIKELKRPDIERYFAPVLSHSKHGAWLVMPLAKNVGMYDYEKVSDTLYGLGITCYDAHAYNIGELDGHPAIIDYEDMKCRIRRRRR